MDDKKIAVCIGDSIVEGYPYGEDASWVEHVQKKRENQELWINAGISGQLTSQICRRIHRDALRFSPERVIISCGTNDFIFLTGPESEAPSAFSYIKTMAEEVLRIGAEVMICAPPLTIPHMASRRWDDGTDYDEVNRKLRELRESIRIWCEETPRAVFLDVLGAYETWCQQGAEELWYVDGLHPTGKGYEAIGEYICETLPRMKIF